MGRIAHDRRGELDVVHLGRAAAVLRTPANVR
jgi:hypothetical protein